MTSLTSLITQGGTATFSREELQAERPTISELYEQASLAVRAGDYERAVTYQDVIWRRLEDARKTEDVSA